MRTHILIAAALALSATTAVAAPRSLSAPQSNPVQPAPEAAKPLEAPVFKIQSSEEVKPAPQPQAAPEPAPAPAPVQAAPAPAPAPAPVQAAPAPAPAAAGGARTVETAPVAEARPAPAARRVRHAQRRTNRQHTASVEQRVNSGLRSIERKIGGIGIAVGAAAALSAIPYAIPSSLYW